MTSSQEPTDFQAHGGPYTLETLQKKYPFLDAAAIEIRRRCVASPLYLAANVLSKKWETNLLNRPSKLHREVEQAMLAQSNLLYVDARGTAKTTLLDEVGTIWQFLKYPNDVQLLTHSSLVNAKSLSASVRLHLRDNELFRGLFPEYAIDDRSEEGNILAWSVPCRTLGGREESVEVGTPGTSMAGRHYNVVRCSDWMNENTTPLYGLGSIENMTSLVELFSQVQGLLKGKEVCSRVHYTIDSNRWHDGDLAGTLIRNDKDKNTIRKVIGGVTGESGNFTSSWPEVKTPQMIQAIYDDPAMTPAMFAANFRSDPLPDGGKAFKREWLHRWGSGVCPVPRCGKVHEQPSQMDIVITCDPAFTDDTGNKSKHKSDRSALVVSGISADPDTRGHLFVLQTRAGRWTPNEFVENLWSLISFWKPSWVGIEDTGSSRGLKSILLSRMARLGQFVQYHDLKHGSKSKEARIAPLHAHAEQFGLFLKHDQAELAEELLRFGVAKHEDLADALAYRAIEMYDLPANLSRVSDVPTIKRSYRMTAPEALSFIESEKRTGGRLPWEYAISGRN